MDWRFRSPIYATLPCGNACVYPWDYEAAEEATTRKLTTYWRLNCDPSEEKLDPVTALRLKSVNVDRICSLAEIHNTCMRIRINDDPHNKVYVIKTVNQLKNVSHMHKEMILLATIPPHRNIMSRPAIATAYWTQHDFKLNRVTNSGMAVVGYITEYVHSGTLEANLKGASEIGREIPGPTQVSWALQLIDALIHLHRVAKLAHLALKPDNILVDTDPANPEEGGRVILIDFEQSATTQGFRSYLCQDLKRAGDNIVRSDSTTEACDVHALATILWMIFESEGSYETMFLQDPPPGAVSFTRRPTSTMLNWFRSTPICLRKILYDCTSPRQRRFYPKLETLRETIADQTRHPWSPIYRSFDSSQTSNLWQMQVDAGELPAAFTDLYGKYSQTFEAFMRDFKSRSKGRKEKAEETSTMEAGDTKHEIKTPGDAKEEDFKEIKTTGVRVKDAEQKETQAEISRLMSHIGNWHEAKTGCYCVLPPEDIWMSIEHIAENTWRRKRAHH